MVERRTTTGPWAEIALLGIAMVWGLTFPMVQDAIGSLPTFAFLAYRFIPASLLIAIIFRKQLATLTRSGWIAGAFMGVFLTGGYAFQTLGLDRTTSSKAGFITGLFVVLTPIFGAIFLGQRAGRLAWGAAVISTIGLYLLSGSGGGFNSGDALVLVTACSFALHILVTGRAVAHHDVGALLAIQLGVCGVFSLIVAGIGGDVVVPDETQVWVALFVTAFIASALGFFVQTYAQQHAPPARTALILAAEPAFAGLFSWLLKGETLSPTGWAGAALILAAIVTVELVPYLRTKQPLPEH